MCRSPADIAHAVMAILDKGSEKPSTATVIRRVSRNFSLSSKSVRSVIGNLVAGGELAYCYAFGTSFLVRSFQRPVRVSDRVVLCPENRTVDPAPHETVVFLKTGAAFGAGDHPTTRLGVRGVEVVLGAQDSATRHRGGVLDIGTGSGVLAIAAVLLGMDSGIGTDIDPCALAEASANVEINGLAGRIRIENRHWRDFPDPFDLITANLRLPTLTELQPDMKRLCSRYGSVVMTGVRPEEVRRLIGIYGDGGFTCRWRAEEGGWAGLVLGRG